MICLKKASLKRGSLVLLLAALLELAFAATALADSDFVIENGMSQPFVVYENMIYEEVWIEAPVDTDQDGMRDLIYARIARPGAYRGPQRVPGPVPGHGAGRGRPEPAWKEEGRGSELRRAYCIRIRRLL